MKENFTQEKRIIDAGAKALLLITVLFIWILIDTGNVYGQSTVAKIKAHTNHQVNQKDDDAVQAQFREGDGKGDILAEPEEFDGFVVYPNPSAGEMVFDFEFTVRQGETTVGVFDAMGRLASEFTLTEDETMLPYKIDLTNKQPGTYIVVVRHGAQVFTERLLKL